MPREIPDGLHVENEPNAIWDGVGRLVARVNWGMEIEDDAMPTRRVAELFAAAPDLLAACKAALLRYDTAKATYLPRRSTDDAFADEVLRPAIAKAEGHSSLDAAAPAG